MVAADAGNHTTAFTVRSAGETRAALPSAEVPYMHADISIQTFSQHTSIVAGRCAECMWRHGLKGCRDLAKKSF
jgi:hypothetical protein